MFSLPRLSKNEHLGTWLEGCYILPMQLTYNGSIPLVGFPVVKLQAHFHVKNTQPPHHSHLGLEFTNVHQITFYTLLTLFCINLKIHLAFSSFGLQSTLNSFITTKNGTVIKCSAEQKNFKSPSSWCSMNGGEIAS